MYLLLLLACTAKIQVSAHPASAQIYVTDYPASTHAPPQVAVAKGGPDLFTDVSYFAWKQYYVWVGAEGYETELIPIRNEAKIGPIVGGLFVWVPFLWAAGPQEYPIEVELQPKPEAIPSPAP